MNKHRRVDEVLSEFAKRSAQLHREWTAAVGAPDYVKATWRARDDELCRTYRRELDTLGYTGPLVPWTAS